MESFALQKITFYCFCLLEDMRCFVQYVADITNASGAAPLVPVAAASTSKKSPKPRKPAEHPKYREMIASAIFTLKDRRGSSRQAILKHILAHYNLDSEINNVHGRVKMSLRAGVKSGRLKQTKGTGACGSFRLGKTVKAAGQPDPLKTAKATAVAKKVAVTAKKPKSATPRKLKGKSHKKGALAKKPKAESPAKKGAKPKKVVKKTPTKKRSSSKLAKK